MQIRDKRSYEDAENFMATVAEYKQVKSAKILERMLNGKPFVPRYVDSVYLQRIIKNAIWNNQCNAYAQLLKQIGPEPKRDNTNDGIVLDTSVTIPPQKIRW